MLHQELPNWDQNFHFWCGTESGAPIPLKRNGDIESYKKDSDGEVVITK